MILEIKKKNINSNGVKKSKSVEIKKDFVENTILFDKESNIKKEQVKIYNHIMKKIENYLWSKATKLKQRNILDIQNKFPIIINTDLNKNNESIQNNFSFKNLTFLKKI